MSFRQPIQFAALFLLFATSVFGQNRFGPGGPNFPSVGSQLPNVEVFDESGKKFSTDKLRGKYAVLVFGCLT